MREEAKIPTETDAKQDRELLMVARRAPIHFGFGLAAKADDDALILHKRLAPKMLAKEAKATAKATKVVSGTLSIDGKLLTLTCETAPISGLSKRIRLLLKRMGMPLGIRIIDPNGNLAEEAHSIEGEEEEADDEAVAIELRKAVVELATAHKARLTKEFASRSGTMLNMADAARASGRFDEAVTLLTTLKQELEQAFGPAGTETRENETDGAANDVHQADTTREDLQRLVAARSRLVVLGERMLAQLTQDERSGMSATLKKADAQAKAGDTQDALALITGLIAELEKPVPPTRLMPFWRETREALDRQVVALQKELRKYDHPDLRKIADHGFAAFTDGRNTKLMSAIFDHQHQPSEKSARKVLAAIADYRDLLLSDSVLDYYDRNPFGVPLSFRKTLARGLDGLAALVQRSNSH